MIHYFLKETVLMHTRTVIVQCDGSSLLLECHLTYSAASGYGPYSLPAVMCTHGRVCVCTQVCCVCVVQYRNPKCNKMQ